MTKIHVTYDLQTDANNRREATNKCNYRSNRKEKAFDRQKEMVAIIENKPQEIANQHLLPFLEKYYVDNQKEFSHRVKIAEETFEKEGQKILDRIAKITKFPIDHEQINMFITTYPRCPYNWEKGYIWMAIKMSPEHIKRLLAHEVIHFQFHKYYSDLPEIASLTFPQYDTLKESLTFLINHEFTGRNLAKDNGYPMHQEFRQKLSEYRGKSSKDFKKLILRGANEVKKYSN